MYIGKCERERMDKDTIFGIFTKKQAYLKGHFKLSSGLHSNAYLQCALVLADPIVAEKVSVELAKKIKDIKVDIVLGPAMGGIVFAYEMARALRAKSFFSERDNEGKMQLRRGFSIPEGSRVIIAEDVLTTGRSVKEVITMLKKMNIEPVGIVSLVDRSSGDLDFGNVSVKSLLKIQVETFDPENCPMCQEGMPVEKPGSRKDKE